MYELSDEAKKALKMPVIHTTLSGSIGAWDFTEKDVLNGSFSITNQCYDDSALSIGSVYIGELKGTFLNCTIDRHNLKGKKITASCNLKVGNSYEAIPLGEYYISEANYGASGIEITAYDAMSKFDGTPSIDQSTGTIYGFLSMACKACGVALGMTELEVKALTNGSETLVIRDGNDIETWRDLISWCAQTTATIATVNRSGELVLREYGSEVNDILDTSHRLSGGKFSDFITRYTGISVVNITDQTTSYYGLADDDGLTYNLGSNPLLQVGVQSVRDRERRAVLEKLSAYKFTPYEISVAPVPIYDLCDVISFTDGLAGTSSTGAVTKYEWNFNDKLRLKGSGQDPALASAKSKTDKNIAGLMSQAQQNSESIRWYTYTNASKIEVAEDVETEILSFLYVTTKASKVLLNAEILYDAVTTSDDENDVYNDANVVATIYVNDIAVANFTPWECVQDGKHQFVITYPFNVVSDVTGTIRVTLNISGGSAAIDIANVQAYLMGSGIVGEGTWDGRIEIKEEITSDVAVSVADKINETMLAAVQVPLSSVLADTVSTAISVITDNKVSEDIFTGTNIMVYRPGVNDALVTLTDCTAKDNQWVSSKDGATAVIDRLYGIKSISGYADDSVTFAFSTDGTNWKGYNAIQSEVQDNYEMAWSTVQEMTAELWAQFNGCWLRATIPNGKTVNEISVDGGYVQYKVHYDDGTAEGVTYTVGYGVITPKYKNGGTPTKEGYVFDGWSPEVESIVTNDMTYTAQWKEDTESEETNADS